MAAGCTNAAGPEQPMSGRQTYEQQCARCHGLDGRPTKASPTARDLTNRSYIESLGDVQIRAAIMQGRPAMVAPGQEKLMPAFGNQFSEPELNVLIGYVRSLSDPELGPENLTPEAVGARPLADDGRTGE
ncbi:c-type cytochrome [Enhygromyxa salina]|uniref:c-type cytochrome n=1 Tax=Enhygromyxa salina TaxID=215803 RepID=UPI0011B29122|nr:cytochrome c [Enhygromyxa salina]